MNFRVLFTSWTLTRAFGIKKAWHTPRTQVGGVFRYHAILEAVVNNPQKDVFKAFSDASPVYL